MININELRIGNFISTNGKPINTSDKGMYKALAIDSKDSFEELKGCVTITCDDPRYRDVSAWCQYLEPIPLTPELLKKCGFDRPLSVYQKDHVDVIINKKRLGIAEDVLGNSLIICRYLHQLQNMYYAVMGKELIDNQITTL